MGRALKPALQRLTRLERLALYDNNLGVEGSAVLADILRHPSMSRLQYLDVHDNSFSSLGFMGNLRVPIQNLPNLHTLICFDVRYPMGGKMRLLETILAKRGVRLLRM